MRLIDADALIDDLMERYCKECNKRKGIKNGKYRIIYEIGEAPCRACEVDDVKAELEEAPTADVPDRKVGKWVPVSERLPEVGRNVLMSVGKGMYTAEGFLKGNGKWAQYRWSANLDNVDAWAEMPEPWKGEQL